MAMPGADDYNEERRSDANHARALVGVVIAVGFTGWRGAADGASFLYKKAAYDDKKPINLQGTVTKLELINPHSWIWRT